MGRKSGRSAGGVARVAASAIVVGAVLGSAAAGTVGIAGIAGIATATTSSGGVHATENTASTRAGRPSPKAVSPSPGATASAVDASTDPGYAAVATANLVNVGTLDATPRMQGRSALAELNIAAARGVAASGGSPRTTADATYLDSSQVDGEQPGPGTSVEQSALPDHPEPGVRPGKAADLGLVRVGTGEVLANARWNDETAHPAGAAPLTRSSCEVARVTFLPRSGLPRPVPGLGPSLLDLNAASSRTTTDLVRVPGQDTPGVRATAATALGRLALFPETPYAYTVKVVSPPELSALAAGSSRSDVSYKPAALDIVDAGGATVARLDAPGGVFAVELPMLLSSPSAPVPQSAPAGSEPNAGSAPPARSTPSPERRAAEDVRPERSQPAARSRPKVGVPALPSAPNPAASTDEGALPSLLKQAGAGGGGTDVDRPVALLRVSIGKVDKVVTSRSAQASASAIRIEVVDQPHAATLLDVVLGDLTVAATAPNLPPVARTSGSPATRAPARTPSAAAAAGDETLPVTGVSITVVISTGAALLILGRFAMVVARRRPQ